MAIRWREHEHEEIDRQIAEDADAPNVLRNCGLLKFWLCPSIRMQHELLQLLIGYWDEDLELFQIDGENINLDLEDIYFVTGLSRRGAVPNLKSVKGLPMFTMDEYIAAHCPEGTAKVGTQVPISMIQSIPLKAVLLGIARVTGDAAPHRASRAQMYYALHCMGGTVYDWCSLMLTEMKSQLTSYMKGKAKEFRYGSILVAFFLERVPAMRPRVDHIHDGRTEP